MCREACRGGGTVVSSPPMTSGWGSSDPPKPQSPGTEFGALSHLPTLTNSATPPRGGVNGRKMNLSTDEKWICFVLCWPKSSLTSVRAKRHTKHDMACETHNMPCPVPLRRANNKLSKQSTNMRSMTSGDGRCTVPTGAWHCRAKSWGPGVRDES